MQRDRALARHAKAKYVADLVQVRGETLQALGLGERTLRLPRVPADHVDDLANVLGNRLGLAALLLDGRRHAGHVVHGLSGTRVDVAKRTRRAIGQCRATSRRVAARLDRLHGAGGLTLDRIDELADLAGRTRSALRQLAHLVGDNGKTPALLARARRLDGRIERQQIGLIRNPANHLHDPADILRAVTERADQTRRHAHGRGDSPDLLGCFGNHCHAFIRQALRPTCILGGQLRMSRHRRNPRTHLVKRSHRAVGGAALLGRAFGHVARMLGELLRGRSDPPGIENDLANDPLEVLDKLVEAVGQGAQPPPIHRKALRKIPAHAHGFDMLAKQAHFGDEQHLRTKQGGDRHRYSNQQGTDRKRRTCGRVCRQCSARGTQTRQQSDSDDRHQLH